MKLNYVKKPLWNHTYNQVYLQVKEQVRYQICKSIGEHVIDKTHDRLWALLADQIWGKSK